MPLPLSPLRRRLLLAGLGLVLLPFPATGTDKLPRLTARHAFAGNLDETLYARDADSPVPIASITKLITAWVVVSSDLPMDEKIRIRADDLDRLKHTGSNLPLGSVWTRGQLLEWLLVTSDNRAAAALARTFPGGWSEFLWNMNQLMTRLQLSSFRFGDAAGLSELNRASARDLGVLVMTLAQIPWFREVTRIQAVRGEANVNRFARNEWRSFITGKTGYTLAAGHCLAQSERIGSRPYALVVLHSANREARARDILLLHGYVEEQLKGSA